MRVQDFLLEMGGYYELVLYTDSPATYAEPIINKLDPQRWGAGAAATPTWLAG
jgi:TFIIF-interacting CTD phosphatase-like protein